MKLVTKYFEYDNQIESNLSDRSGSNELFFNFPTYFLLITEFSGFK